MDKEKIIAKSEKGEGLLPMKQGEKQEMEKTDNQTSIETCNFIKNAFCVDGDVEMVIRSKVFFKCNDSKRGKFWVAYGEEKWKTDIKKYLKTAHYAEEKCGKEAKDAKIAQEKKHRGR